jgi:predicted NBD/HSP70 family sugar kinase
MFSRNPSRLTRSLNDRLVIDLLLTHGPLDRPTVAELSGLSKPSVADLISRLIDGGLVEEVGEGASNRRGPNAMRYGLKAGVAAAAGVELQPDHAQVCVADLSGTELGMVNVSIQPGEAPSELVARALRLAAEPSGVDLTTMVTAVIGTPGIVDPSGDMNFVWGQPEWTEGQLARMRDALGVPVRFENDINLAAVAERRVGRARDAESFVLFRCDEGVGAAIMLGSQLVRGSRGAAGEIGYLPDLSREPSLAEEYNEGFQSIAGERALASALADLGLTGHSPAAVLGSESVDGELRDRFTADVARRLAMGVVSVSAVIDPELVVLVGQIASAGGGPGGGRRGRAGGRPPPPRRGGGAGRRGRGPPARVAHTSPFRPVVAMSDLGPDAVVSGAVITALDSARDEIYGVPPVFLRSGPEINRTT